jgi:hypothetical protein
MHSSQRGESIGLRRSSVKCHATRDMKSIERGGGPALEGKCVVCGSTNFVRDAT